MQIFTSEMQYSSSIRLGYTAVKVYLGLPLYQTISRVHSSKVTLTVVGNCFHSFISP